MLIDNLNTEVEAAVAEQDFLKAAHVRDQRNEVQRRLIVVLEELRRNPALQKPLEDDLAAYCCRIDCLASDDIARREADVAADLLLARRPVLAVGPPGSGRKTLAQQIGRALMLRDSDAILPRQLLVPNFLALDDAGEEYGEALLSLLDKLGDGRHYILAVPNLHDCADPALTEPGRRDAWKVALVETIQRQRPLLAWTTPAGHALLQKTWPGVFSAFEIVRLEPLAASAVEEVLTRKLKAVEQTRKVRFEDGFARTLLDASQQWQRQAGLAEPGRSLDLLERLLEFEQERLSTQAKCPLADSPELLQLKERLQRATEAEDFKEAKRLMVKIKELRRRQRLPGKANSRPLIPSSRIAEFLGGQPCR
jgi:hypothetical protein